MSEELEGNLPNRMKDTPADVEARYRHMLLARSAEDRPDFDEATRDRIAVRLARPTPMK